MSDKTDTFRKLDEVAAKLGSEAGSSESIQDTERAHDQESTLDAERDFNLPTPPEPEEYDVQAVTEQEFQALRSIIAIDEDNLSYEWQRQPELYIQAQWMDARAAAAITLNKLAIETRQAQLARQYRRNGIEGLSGRVTEEAIKNEYQTDPLVVRLKFQQAHLLYREKMTAALVKTLEHRILSLKYKTLPGLPGAGAVIADEEARTYSRAARRIARRMQGDQSDG